MTEANKLENKPEEVLEEKQAYVPKDKWEEKAIASGKWKPLEEWEGDPDDWRPAREYVERGELFDKIDSQKKELKQMRKVLDTLKDHHLRVKQESMEEAIALLQKQRSQAKKEEDYSKVIEITDEIETLKDKQKKAIEKAQAELAVPTSTEVEPSETFKKWNAENSWYKMNGKDPMTVYANVMADEFLRERSGKASEEEVFEYVEKKVREEFPEKFKREKVDPKVEGVSSTRPVKTKEGTYQFTDAERAIGKTLVESGVMTWDQYAKDLKSYDTRKS